MLALLTCPPETSPVEMLESGLLKGGMSAGGLATRPNRLSASCGRPGQLRPEPFPMQTQVGLV